MNYRESATFFDCSGDPLVGILSVPEAPSKTAVLIIVGGPQYRVGSHRQFVLLARKLAGAGYPCFRFDYRGMGDSAGEAREFDEIAEDIGAAVNHLFRIQPGLKRVVLWGLCDAASASLIYCSKTSDSRVVGMVLLNPWVRSEATLAQARMQHYYGRRLLSADLWRKLAFGRFSLPESLSDLWENLRLAGGKSPFQPGFKVGMLGGLRSFSGPLLILLSGEDLTAREFTALSCADHDWKLALDRENVTWYEIAGADHTFSSASWRDAVEFATLNWLNGLEAA